MTDKVDLQVAEIFEFTELISVLSQDVLHNMSQHDWSSTIATQQICRRALVRSVFAMVEGTVYRMKQMALTLDSPLAPAFSQGEMDLLNEQTYRLASNGDVKASPAKIDLEANIKFAFKMVKRVMDVKHDLDASGTAWREFTHCIKVRNRLTHPKQVDDLLVTDNEYGAVLTAWSWFQQNLYNTFGVSPTPTP